MRLRPLQALLVFFTCAIPSSACDCGPPGPASRYVKDASIVFVGKVIFTDDDGSGTFIQKTLVHFEVEEAFKGLQPELRDVWVDPGSYTSCYATYRVGERYLVFGYGGALLPKDSAAVTLAPRKSKEKPLPPGIESKNPPRVYSAPECSGTRPILPITKDSISHELDYLRKYKEQTTKEESSLPKQFLDMPEVFAIESQRLKFSCC